MNKEKRLYQKNNLGYNFVIWFIILNTIYTIFKLNSMPVNLDIGIFVVITIILSLMGFLIAVKVRSYSLFWSYGSCVIGIIQLVRYFFDMGNIDIILSAYLIVSAICIILAGFVSIKRSKERISYILENNLDEKIHP
ncbi:hypothetical protein [Defluviitalea phaphyphila]|uniref:hypothetical protein n=1 Tax=Defluviitalea phaphyphila TaxID=1473580 RepID=UPI000731C770|nr:hypothetical protein [Defluviitalea phaphyphila]